MADQKPESALHVEPGVSFDPNRAIKLPPRRRALEVSDYVAGVTRGDRALIGRTFSLMESQNPKHRETAGAVLERLMPYTGQAFRIGLSGVPGVGKSTFIESFGTILTKMGKRVAVLTVDPSSELSGGSILGDKTRMEKLATDPNAFVRPSACGDWLGGVARGTRESIYVCEAAGYDVVIVETVGVGQSETQVSSMVDFFLLLMLAGAGDELQGIKRGIIELADTIVVNKADGENRQRARVARQQYQGALRLLRPTTEGWDPLVLTCSAVTGEGLEEIWKVIQEHRELMESSGQLEIKRDKQALFWMHQAVDQLLVDRFYSHPEVKRRLEEFTLNVVEGRISPFVAAEQLIEIASKEANPQS